MYEYNKKFKSTNLFTTEKIDSLINLVRRIIIIDKDQIIFDGAIDEILEKFAKEKIVKAKLSLPIDIKLASEIGVVKKYIYPYLYISAPRSVISFTAAEMMQNFPIISLNIEELSVEEIIENMKK
jgi:ABC-2 type transport system ATP-binding protein